MSENTFPGSTVHVKTEVTQHIHKKEIIVKPEFVETKAVEDDTINTEVIIKEEETESESMISKYKKYVCDLCPKRFKQQYALKEHRQEDHGKKSKECVTCGKTFANSSTLKRHTKRFHSLSITDAFPHICEICNERFCILKKLSDHKKLHVDPDTFKCTEKNCGKVFADSFALTRHSKRHSQVKYTCKTCKRTYKCSEDLQKHVGIHTGDFWCDMCYKVFPSKGALTSHKKSCLVKHSYNCDVCGECFRCNIIRLAHQKNCERTPKARKAEGDFETASI